MTLSLDNPDFDSCKADVPNTLTSLELLKTGTDDYTIFYHNEEQVYELGCYTKEELRVIYLMLQDNEYATRDKKRKS